MCNSRHASQNHNETVTLSGSGRQATWNLKCKDLKSKLVN